MNGGKQDGRVVVYCGGFAAVGGVEEFVADLVSAASDGDYSIEVWCWGKECVLLDKIRRSGSRVFRGSWRWGCRWLLPDRLLLRRALKRLDGRTLILFPKILPEFVHKTLLAVRGNNSLPRFVAVTPYRPSELWPDGVADPITLKSLDAMVVQAESFREDLRLLGYGGEVEVLPYIPPSPGPVAPFPPLATMRIGYLGRLVHDKNLRLLLDAFRVLNEERASELHIYGTGALEQALRQDARSLGIHDRVFFHGWIPRERVPEAIDACHMFALSSTTEGQCLAALDILSRGRPLVATPVGALPEILTSAALGRIAPFDPRGFAESLRETAAGITGGSIRPDDVRTSYDAKFPRAKIIQQYRDLLARLSDPQEERSKPCLPAIRI